MNEFGSAPRFSSARDGACIVAGFERRAPEAQVEEGGPIFRSADLRGGLRPFRQYSLDLFPFAAHDGGIEALVGDFGMAAQETRGGPMMHGVRCRAVHVTVIVAGVLQEPCGPIRE